MAKRAVLEASHFNRERMGREAEAFESNREYRAALERAEAAVPHFSDSIAYQRRFLKCSPSIPEVDRILRLAPPLFAHRSLATLQAYCDARKKLEREAIPDLENRLDRAREILEEAARVWSELFADRFTSSHEVRLGRRFEPVLEVWKLMGAITRTSEDRESRHTVVTNMSRPVRAKCAGCGRVGRAPTAKLLEPRTCPACRQRCWFVFLRET